ncbi:MAG: SDR family oxidoreductase [Planctomycetaceae bacterium]
MKTSSTHPVVYITGVSRGLGRALVSRFAEAHWTVVGCARTATAINELSTQFQSPHRFDMVDLTDSFQVDNWARKVIASHGPPRLLINNAAVVNEPQPLWKISAEEFSRVMNINIDGTFHVLRSVVPAMIEACTGVIVNLSSGWGRSTSPEVAPYCASKWAIEGLTQAFAQELPSGLAAVALNPGIIDTDMLRQCWQGATDHFPSAEEWSRLAAPFLMQLGPQDNGRSLDAPSE